MTGSRLLRISATLAVLTAALASGVLAVAAESGPARMRARELGIAPGALAPGPLNAITDVAGVLVGHTTVVRGDRVRTGVTAIRPHPGNVFQEKVPAAIAVANGFGKLMGVTQVRELGEIETPIVLTNTLAVGRAAEAVIDWTLAQPGNERVVSVNAVVGETNDSRLNDIRARGVTTEDVLSAIRAASGGPVAQGSVGAGTGTVAFGWKGGIGTSSRRLEASQGGFTVGVLVQSNFGGELHVAGRKIGRAPRLAARPGGQAGETADGSIMIVLATDAPLDARQLERLARRTFAGLARTGAAFSHGSGDYAIAFSTHPGVRRTPQARSGVASFPTLPDEALSPLFVAAADATEEAILDSLLMATSVSSVDPFTGRPVTVEALDIERVRAALRNE